MLRIHTPVHAVYGEDGDMTSTRCRFTVIRQSASWLQTAAAAAAALPLVTAVTFSLWCCFALIWFTAVYCHNCRLYILLSCGFSRQFNPATENNLFCVSSTTSDSHPHEIHEARVYSWSWRINDNFIKVTLPFTWMMLLIYITFTGIFWLLRYFISVHIWVLESLMK